MLVKRSTLLILAALLAGCANEASSQPPMLNMMQLGVDTAGATEAAPDPLADVKASKVLSANAFERATGLTTDPQRLIVGD